jgi:hypothetical protein
MIPTIILYQTVDQIRAVHDDAAVQLLRDLIEKARYEQPAEERAGVIAEGSAKQP